MQFIEKVAGDNQEGLQQLYDLIKKDTGANEFKVIFIIIKVFKKLM